MRKLLVLVLSLSCFFTVFLQVVPHAYAITAADEATCQAKNHDVTDSDGTKRYIEYTASDFGCVPNDPVEFAKQYYGIGLSIIGGVALMFIIYGGYTLMLSQGNPTAVNKAKSYIFYAIAGLLLAIFGYVFIQVVLIDILHIPGFN